MDDPRTLRLAGYAGLVFSALSLIVIPLTLTLPPPLGSSAPAWAQWYREHRWGFLVGNYLGVAAFFPGFVQLAVLSAGIRKREEATGWLAWLVFGCGTFTYAVFACSLIAFQAMPFLVDPAVPQATHGMGVLTSLWFALDGLAAVPFVIAVAWATRATQVLPRWFAHLSWVVAAMALLMSVGGLVDTPPWLAGGGPITGLGFVAFFGWTAVLAVICLRAGADLTAATGTSASR